jgi:hypothetical protein
VWVRKIKGGGNNKKNPAYSKRKTKTAKGKEEKIGIVRHLQFSIAVSLLEQDSEDSPDHHAVQRNS